MAVETCRRTGRSSPHTGATEAPAPWFGRLALLTTTALALALASCAVVRPVAGPPPAAPASVPFQEGIASWYGPGFAGRRTASGEVFDPSKMTAAHPTLPFGTWVRVVHAASAREVVVRINDRGPDVPGRVIDLSRAAAEALGIVQSGVAPVRLFLVDPP